MASNWSFKCVSCNADLSSIHGILMHKCLAFYCESCVNIQECISCKIHILASDFIHFNKIESCYFYDKCKNQATVKCSCINKAICGQHLINIHADIPGEKCDPEILFSDNMEIMCSKCNKLFARYINKSNEQEICVSCFHEIDSNDFVLKDKFSHDHLKSKLDLINNALNKTIELNKNHFVEFSNSIEQKKKATDEAINQISKFIGKCNQENMEKLVHMRSLNDEAVVAFNKIKEMNITDMILQAARNKQIDIKSTLDKWQTWIKERVQKLENPSISRISIEFQEEQESSNSHKIIVRQEQHLSSCNYESCHPGNNMMVIRNIITELDNLTARNKTSIPIPGSCVENHGVKRPCEHGEASGAKRYETSISLRDDDSDNESIFAPEDDGPLFMSHSDSYVRIDSSSHVDMEKLTDDCPIHVKLTSIRCPFWFHLEDPEYANKRADILQKLNKEPINRELKIDVKPNAYAVIEDDKKYGLLTMKRAKIKSQTNEPDFWLVRLLDYGRDCKVHRNKIYNYPAVLDEFTQETCFRAALIGVKPLSNFIFVHIIQRNATNYIKEKLLPPSEILTVYRRFKSPDGRIFCDIKFKSDGVEIDWATELISANLASPHDGPFMPSKNYCYIGHYTGKCRESCPYIHVCPYCHGKHFLVKCPSFVKKTKEQGRQSYYL